MTEKNEQAQGSELSDGLGPVLRTGRGFQYIEFQDRNGNTCDIQQSSVADYEPPGSSALWLGIGENRMHISLDQMRLLIPVLQRWVDTGKLA